MTATLKMEMQDSNCNIEVVMSKQIQWELWADGQANMSALRVKAITKQECVICMQHQETEMRLLRCGHRPLCAGRLVEWLNAQASSQAARCPMCQEQGEG